MKSIGTRGVFVMPNHTLTGHEIEIVFRDQVTNYVTIRILKDHDAYRAGEVLKYRPKWVRTLPPNGLSRPSRPNPKPNRKPV